MPDLKPILADWAAEVIVTAQRNLGATVSVKETNASGTRIKKRRRVASGTLKRSLSFFVRKGSGNTSVKFIAKGAAARYADVINQGRRPNSKPPPVYAILQWMKTKPIRIQKKGGGFIKTSEKEKEQYAFLIARKIGKYGIAGTHYFTEAVDQHLPELELSLQYFIEKSIADVD